jgi:hypothetical protein
MADPPRYPDPTRGAGDDTDPGPAPSMPRWVKVFGIAFVVLVLVIAVMFASGHGPGRHMAAAGPGGWRSSTTGSPMHRL